MAELDPDDATVSFFDMITIMSKSYPDFSNPAKIINTMSLGQIMHLLHASLEFSLGVIMSEADSTGETTQLILNEWRERYIQAVLESDV